MLVNLFKSKTPIAIFSLPLIIALMGIAIFFKGHENPYSFFTWQAEFIEVIQSQIVLHYFLAIFIVYLSAIEVNRLVNVYGFYGKNTYLPGLVYSILLFSFGQVQFSTSVLAFGILIYGMGYLFRINRQDPALSSVFLAALFFGIATVLEPLLTPIVLLPWFALVVFRSFIWREWFALILGLAIPWFYHYALLFFLTGKLDIRREGLVIINDEIEFSFNQISLFVFLGIITILAIWQYLVIANSQLLVFKKRSRLLFHFIWLSLISIGFGWLFYDIFIITIAIPMSIIIGVYFLNMRSGLFVNGLLYIWIALILWNTFS